jgi:uncharacterized protein YlxW (UPF0749 family)
MNGMAHGRADSAVAGGSMSLLTQLTEQAIDDDYAIASKRHATDATGREPHLALVVLVVFGALLATAALQAARSAPMVAQERSAMIDQINQRSAALTAAQSLSARLGRQISAAQAELTGLRTRQQALLQRVHQLGVETGAVGLAGPGVKIVANDATGGDSRHQGQVLDVDLASLVNGLWSAGAQAIAINGHRLSALSAIRGAGHAITVDYSSLNPPYVVVAIGNPDTLPARFLDSSGGQAWLSLKANFGLRFSVTSEPKVRVPPDPQLMLCCAHARPARP